MNGIFTISLDFELHWGGFEKWKLEAQDRRLEAGNAKLEPPTTNYQLPTTNFKQYFLNTRGVIPQMLQLFEGYQIHVTWAGVGMLFHQSKESLVKCFPGIKPSYLSHELSAYEYITRQGIGEDEAADPFHYAHSLVHQIIKTPYQELGSHTFSHFYCNEDGQTVEQFRADLRAAQQSARLHNTQLKSLVFPRNQFNDDYLKVCFEEGFTSVRSNPIDWFWKIQSAQNEGFWKRLNRGLDAYFPIGEKNTYQLSSIEKREGYPICIPASRLLRPYRPQEFFLNRFKIERIKSEIKRAAQVGEVYHLWWHPHNFGWHPHQSMLALEEILKTYQACSSQFGMVSKNMHEITQAVYTLHGESQAA